MHDLTRSVKRLALAYCSSILSIFLSGARSVNAQAPQQSAPQTAQGPSTAPAPNAIMQAAFGGNRGRHDDGRDRDHRW